MNQGSSAPNASGSAPKRMKYQYQPLTPAPGGGPGVERHTGKDKVPTASVRKRQRT